MRKKKKIELMERNRKNCNKVKHNLTSFCQISVFFSKSFQGFLFIQFCFGFFPRQSANRTPVLFIRLKTWTNGFQFIFVGYGELETACVCGLLATIKIHYVRMRSVIIGNVFLLLFNFRMAVIFVKEREA